MPSRALRTAVLALLVSFGLVETASAYYNPRTGRFLNRDPVGEPGAMLVRHVATTAFIPRDIPGGEPNPYLTFRNNPNYWIDPDGLQAQASQPATQPTDPPLVDVPGAPVPPRPKYPPEGWEVPGTGGDHQNCAGRSCGERLFLNWPSLGLPCDDAKWAAATQFTPKGCRRVPCAGVSLQKTLCDPCKDSLELVVFLYRWPTTARARASDGTIRNVRVHQCDFHMVGRDPCKEQAWRSKQDRRNEWDEILDPWQSLYTSYPHTRQADVKQLCLCCDKSKMEFEQIPNMPPQFREIK